jgi:3-hydroxy-3-methylglutaryl CoA synthase
MTISDNIKEIAGIIFCESSIVFTDKEGKTFITYASAGIDPNRKGMDIAQSFGSSSSYSRKYALSAIFLLDDTKDADATNMHDAVKMVEEKLAKTVLKVGTDLFKKCRAGYLKDATNLHAIQERFSMSEETLRILTAKPNEII